MVVPEFTSDWFPKHVFEGPLGHLKQIPGFRVLEVGTFEGRGALYFLEHFLDASGSLTCIDPFVDIPVPGFLAWDAAAVRTRFIANTKPYVDRRILIEEPSAAVWPRLADGAFDLVFVDGDHRREAVAIDAREGFRVLRPGGHLVFDDYLWGVEHGYGPEAHPKDAIDGFLDLHRDRLRVVRKDRCVVIQKNQS